VVVSSEGSYPAIVVTVTTPTTGTKKQFTIALVEIAEENPLGDLVGSVDLTSTVFNLDYSFDSSLQSWTFSANITGYGQMYAYFTYEAGTSVTRSTTAQTLNTLRMQVDLDSWALKSAQNSLQLICENSIVDLDIDDCSVETSVYAGNLEWFMLHSDGVALYYELSQTADLDGYTRFITNNLVSNANTLSTIPFFWYNMSLTTTFGFLPDPNYTGCNLPAVAHAGGTKWKVYLSIPAVIIFIVIVLIVLMFILRPARCFRQRRPVSDTKHPMMSVGSEMVILPPSSSPPPSETPPPAWQGDPRASTSNLPVDPRDSAAYPPPGHMSMQYPPSNHTYRTTHASSPYPQQYQHQPHHPHHDDHGAPQPSAPLPSPEPNKNYLNDEHHE